MPHRGTRHTDRWTEYSSELYNHKTNEDPSALNCPQTDTEDDHPILRKEVEAAVQSLQKGKSAGVDNIPAELVQAGGEDVITAPTLICNKIWQTGEWSTLWTQSLVITLPKKSNLQQCQNYRTIRLTSHLNKVMLKIILTRFKPQKKVISEEQAERGSIEQIFNLRILCEKYRQHTARLLLCLHKLQEGLRQGLVCTFVGNQEETQYQRLTSFESINTYMVRPLEQSSSTVA